MLYIFSRVASKDMHSLFPPKCCCVSEAVKTLICGTLHICICSPLQYSDIQSGAL